MERLAGALVDADWRVASAESCTGGLLGQRLTSISGASAWYSEGFVTYTNEAKVRRLGVRPETLRSEGAVGAQVAAEMARGAQRRAGVEAALALTGIAGPTGGSVHKPVGTVWLGMAVGEELF